VRAHIDEVTPSAERIGACNMIRRNDDGSLSGTMLDGEGFVAGLRAAGHRVAGKRVVLLGAGGAAGAIAFALCEGGAVEVSIHNRTAATADALQRRLETHYPGQTRVLTRLAQADSPDIIVNATSLGLHSRDALPLDPDVLRPGMLAAEVVIAEGPTPFLAAAQQRGCAVHGGRSMLEAQLDLMLEFAGVGHGG